MKRFVIVLAVGLALFALAACSSKEGEKATPPTVDTHTTETVPDTPTGNELTDSWTPATESIVLSLIRQQPALADYAPSCVLDQIETEYSTPQDYIDAAESDDDSVTSVAIDVFRNC